jgi:hypothetical protein
MTERTRAEHLAWCKERALEYVEDGDLINAVSSMISDMQDLGTDAVNPFLMMIGALDAQAGDAPAVRRWIEGTAVEE